MPRSHTFPVASDPAQDGCMGVHLHRRLSGLVLVLALAAAALPAAARGQDADAGEPVVIYRCTDGDGHLALRDSPCSGDADQQVIRMQRPEDPPPAQAAPGMPEKPAEPAAASPTAPPPPTRVVVVERPAPVYECVTPDGERYTSASPAGHPRRVPLWTLGYPAYYAAPRPAPPRIRHRIDDGNRHLYNDLVFDGIGRPSPRPSDSTPGPPRLPPAVGIARTPATWIRDRCTPLPQAQVCTRLRDRYWELRGDYHSALQSEREHIDTEQRAISARLAQDC